MPFFWSASKSNSLYTTHGVKNPMRSAPRVAIEPRCGYMAWLDFHPSSIKSQLQTEAHTGCQNWSELNALCNQNFRNLRMKMPFSSKMIPFFPFSAWCQNIFEAFHSSSSSPPIPPFSLFFLLLYLLCLSTSYSSSISLLLLRIWDCWQQLLFLNCCRTTCRSHQKVNDSFVVSFWKKLLWGAFML